jgi:hypothetical protein
VLSPQQKAHNKASNLIVVNIQTGNTEVQRKQKYDYYIARYITTSQEEKRALYYIIA